MPILHVRHATSYRYRRPVTIGPHRLMVRPRDSHDLRLISAALSCAPPATLIWSHDVFGNSVAQANISEPADTLSIVSEIVVEQCVPDWPVFAIAAFAHSYPFAYTPDEQIDLGALMSNAASKVCSPSPTPGLKYCIASTPNSNATSNTVSYPLK